MLYDNHSLLCPLKHKSSTKMEDFTVIVDIIILYYASHPWHYIIDVNSPIHLSSLSFHMA